MKTKKKKQRKPDSVFVRLFLLVFVCAVGIGVAGQMRTLEEVKGEQILIAQEIAAEEQKQMDYENKKEYYNSDSYIEQAAREELGMIKSNEVLYVNKGE